MEDKMKQTIKALSVILTTLFLVVSLSFVCLAGDKSPVASSATNLKVIQSVPNLDICKDPAVSNFNVTKTLSGNVVTFTITGQVCNNGPGDYNQPDNALQATFGVYPAYAPQYSYAAAGEAKFFTKPVGTVLKKNQCMSFSQTYAKDKVLHLGLPSPAMAPKPNEKGMKLLIEFFVRDAKGLIGTSAMPKALDCNTNNNLLSQTFEMTISTP